MGRSLLPFDNGTCDHSNPIVTTSMVRGRHRIRAIFSPQRLTVAARELAAASE
jgi:hypothetical protein